MKRNIQKMIESMTLEKVSPDTLSGWDQNPRVHGDVDQLVKSIDGYGWTSPILAQRGTGRIVAGHRRVQAALKKRLKVVPVIFLDFTEEEAAGYTVADNATSDQSDWDFGKLNEILGDLKIKEFDIDLTALQFGDISAETLSLKHVPKSGVVKLRDLKLHPMDFRTPSEEEIEHVSRNLKAFGLFRDVVVSSDDYVLSGQEIVAAAKKNKVRQLPVKRLGVSHDDPEALKLLIGDRETANLTEIDDRKLTDLLVTIDKTTGLEGTGYDKKRVAALLLATRAESEIPDANAASQWVGLPEFANGPEIYKLVVSFRSAEDRDEFLRRNELEAAYGNRNTTACWWPKKEIEDAASVAWKEST